LAPGGAALVMSSTFTGETPEGGNQGGSSRQKNEGVSSSQNQKGEGAAETYLYKDRKGDRNAANSNQRPHRLELNWKTLLGGKEGLARLTGDTQKQIAPGISGVPGPSRRGRG